jgi:hypothetical protein
MLRKSLVLGIILAGVLLILGLKVVVSFARFSRVERPFANLRQGDSQTLVIAKLGTPNYHAGRCGDVVPSPENCAHEYVYSDPLAPWIPDYYVVEFSAEGSVIRADYITSP